MCQGMGKNREVEKKCVNVDCSSLHLEGEDDDDWGEKTKKTTMFSTRDVVDRTYRIVSYYIYTVRNEKKV